VRRSLERTGRFAALLAAALIGTAVAQTDPDGHSAHHPGQPAGTAAPAALPGSVPAMPSMPAPQRGAGCGGMMGCMGGPGRPFYASLIDMPALTAEARRVIEAEAERRIGWGSQAITSGQATLDDALSANDMAAAGQAAAGVREGLLLLESGTSALRAIEVGTPPRQLAVTWFRDQLGLPPLAEAAPTAMDSGPWGLSWYHLTSMAFLITFLVGTLLIQHARMRRVNALVRRLSPAPAAGGSPGPAPAPEGTPDGGPPAPPAAVSTAVPIPEAPAVPSPAASAAPSPTAAAAAARRPWSGQLRVAAIFPETPNVKTYRLVSPEGGDMPFTFMPGQFVTFSAEIGGERVRRSYTIASSPTQRSHVEVTVKREEQGLISRHLHDKVAVGSLLEVLAPLGVFTFTGTEADSIVLIAGGVGITPMMSVTRYLTDRSYPGDIYLLYGARTTQDFIFREELEYLQKRHANLHVAATMSRAEGTAWMGPEGPVSKDFIAASVPDAKCTAALLQKVCIALTKALDSSQRIQREADRVYAFADSRCRQTQEVLMSISRIAAVTAFAAAGWLAASAAQAQNVVDVIRQQNDVGIFARIIERSGLTERLSGPGPFAVYAPTDQAFRQHPYAHREAVDRASQPELQRLVLSHVAQHTREENLVSGSGPRSEQMLSGATVRFERQIANQGESATSGGVTINGIGVLDNKPASNGIVHRISGVLTLN